MNKRGNNLQWVIMLHVWHMVTFFLTFHSIIIKLLVQKKISGRRLLHKCIVLHFDYSLNLILEKSVFKLRIHLITACYGH